MKYIGHSLSKVEEPWFSWDGCVGCGSDLGGDRFTGTVYVG